MKILNNIEIEKKELIKYRLKGIEPLLVVAGLIEKEGKYLIAQRITGDLAVIGKWEFPGGKVKVGEAESAAIEREIKEEFNMGIKADRYVTSVIHDYIDRVVYLKLWHATVIDDSFKMDEFDHRAFKLVTLEEINPEDLCPADKRLYVKIIPKN